MSKENHVDPARSYHHVGDSDDDDDDGDDDVIVCPPLCHCHGHCHWCYYAGCRYTITIFQRAAFID